MEKNFWRSGTVCPVYGLALLLLVVSATGFSADDGDDVVVADVVQEAVSAEVSEAFMDTLNAVYGYLNGLERYSARGTLVTRLQNSGAEYVYPFSISKSGARLAMSVYQSAAEEEEGVVARLLTMGRSGSANLYLPREMNAIMMMARLQDQPEGLTVPVILMLYDFLEYSRPERWRGMLSEGRVTGSEKIGGKEAMSLEMIFNNYCSVRDLRVRLAVYDAESITPTIAGLHMDLSGALREMPGLAEDAGDTVLPVELTLDSWTVDAPPPIQDFAMPEPRPHFQTVGVDDLLAFANGRGAAALAGAGVLPQSLPQSPAAAAAMISRFKALPPSEQARLIRQYRNSPEAARLKSQARQMGLSEQDIRHIKSQLMR